jgi:hypothetical protein
VIAFFSETHTHEVLQDRFSRCWPASAWRSQTQAQNISIATGGTGGVYYPMGGRPRGRACPSTCPGMQATAEVTGRLGRQTQADRSGKPYVGYSA